jgi:selenide,water dikinase
VWIASQGPPLAENLRRYLTGQELLPFVPQSQALALISAGDRWGTNSEGQLPPTAAQLQPEA